MVREKEIFFKNILQVIDIIVITIAFFVSFVVMGFIRNIFDLGEMAMVPSFNFYGAFIFFKNSLLIFFSAIFFWMIFLTFFGVYRDFRTTRFLKIIFCIIKSSIASTLATGSVIFLSKMTLTSRLYIVLFSITSIVLLLIEKRIALNIFEIFRKSGYYNRNLMIVGTGKRAQNFIKAVNKYKKWGFDIVGLIDDEPAKVGTSVMGVKVRGRLADIPKLLHDYVVDRVVFVVPRSWLGKIEDAILACENEGVGTFLSLDLYNTKISRTKQTDFGGIPLLEFETFSAHEWQMFFKRSIDLIVAIIGIILTSPLFIFIIIGIKLSSKGQIIFKQERSGLNGRGFTLYKFRTMVV